MRTRLILILVAVLLLIPVVGLGVLVYTETGVNLIATQLWRLERFNMKIDGLSGTLSGPLRVARFELNHPRVHLVSKNIVIDPQLRGLLLQTLQTGYLRVGETLVEMHQVQMPKNNRPPRFVPSFLRIDARNVELLNVRYVHMNGTVVPARMMRGRVTVTSNRLTAHDFSVDADLFDATGDLRLRAAATADLPMGLAGETSGQLHLPDVDVVLNAAVDGTIDELKIKAEVLQPNAVAVDALMTRPENSWKVAGRVTSQQFLLNPWLEKPPLSLRNIALDVVMVPEEIHARGNVGIPELDEHDLTIDARGRYSNRTLSVSAAELQLHDSPATLHTSGQFVFDGSAPTVDLQARWQKLQWPLRGKAVVVSEQGDGTLRGPLPYDFTVTANLAGPNIPSGAGSATGVLSKEEVIVASYSVNALGGSLTGDGQLQFAQPRAWRVSTRADNVNPSQLFKQVDGRIHLQAKASGQGFDKKASFIADIANLSGTLRGEPVQGRGFVQRDRDGWTVRNAQVGVADSRLALNGIWKQTIDATWSLQVPSLKRLLPEASGSIESKGRANGPLKSLHVTGDLRADKVRYEQWQADQLAIDADIDASGKSQSRLVASARGLGAGEPLIASMQLNGEGTALDHRINMNVTGAAATPRDKPPGAEMQIAGRYDQQVWNATATTTKLETGQPNEDIKIAEPARITASAQRAQLDNFCLLAGKGRVCASGKWEQKGAWEGTVSGYEIPLAHRRSRSRIRCAESAMAGGRGCANHRCPDRLSPTGRQGRDIEAWRRRSRSYGQTRARQLLLRCASIHGYVLVRERADRAQRQ
jgi:translocation and assembly module TamB